MSTYNSFNFISRLNFSVKLPNHTIQIRLIFLRLASFPTNINVWGKILRHHSTLTVHPNPLIRHMPPPTQLTHIFLFTHYTQRNYYVLFYYNKLIHFATVFFRIGLTDLSHIFRKRWQLAVWCKPGVFAALLGLLFKENSFSSFREQHWFFNIFFFYNTWINKCCYRFFCRSHTKTCMYANISGCILEYWYASQSVRPIDVSLCNRLIWLTLLPEVLETWKL